MVHVFKRIFALWRPHRWLGVSVGLMMLLQTVFTVVLAVSIKLIIDGAISGESDARTGLIILLLIAGFVVSTGARVAAGYLRAKIGARILADVRTSAFEHLQRLSVGFHAQSHQGDLLARFSTDVGQLSLGVVKKPLDGLKSMAALAMFIPVMVILDLRLTVLTFILMPLSLLLALRFSPDADRALDEEKGRIADVLEAVRENLSAQPVIRAFGLAGRTRARFRERIEALEKTSTRSVFRVALMSTIAQFAVQLAQLAIVAVGATLALNGSLEPGTLAAFVALLTEFTRETTAIGSEVLPEITNTAAGIRRIDSLLASGPVVVEPPNPRPAPPITEGIRFEDVSFEYEANGDQQLSSITLDLPAGRYVAIVGPSGSGKSTLLNLLLRFYDPSSGRVTIDSVDLRELEIEELRASIGVVFQDTFLFNASVRDNVALARPGATDEELHQAARRAGLEQVVAVLPDGYGTKIGSEGRRLSGGQRQRIGIARALLRRPRLLLLDEVTLSLDPMTEAAVNETLRSVRGGPTIVAVTHRLHAAADADLIVVLDEGRIEEIGTFEELRDAGGTFTQMWKKQLGFTISSDGHDARVNPERLHSIPLFSEFEPPQLEDLTGRLVSNHHSEGDIIFRQGDPADRFYVIARGVVEVIASDDGQDKVIAHLNDGDFFGEMALLNRLPRNATIQAVTPVLTLSLDRSQFAELLGASPTAAAAVQGVAAERAKAPRY